MQRPNPYFGARPCLSASWRMRESLEVCGNTYPRQMVVFTTTPDFIQYYLVQIVLACKIWCGSKQNSAYVRRHGNTPRIAGCFLLGYNTPQQWLKDGFLLLVKRFAAYMRRHIFWLSSLFLHSYLLWFVTNFWRLCLVQVIHWTFIMHHSEFQI